MGILVVFLHIRSRILSITHKVTIMPAGAIPFTLPVVFPLSYNYKNAIGDINGEDTVGLEEANHAPQVTAGIRQQ